jgi:hypothetical protein
VGWGLPGIAAVGAAEPSKPSTHSSGSTYICLVLVTVKGSAVGAVKSTGKDQVGRAGKYHCVSQLSIIVTNT